MEDTPGQDPWRTHQVRRTHGEYTRPGPIEDTPGQEDPWRDTLGQEDPWRDRDTPVQEDPWRTHQARRTPGGTQWAQRH